MRRRNLIGLCLALLCFLPMTIQAAEDLIVGGDSIGIQVQYEGVMITGTYGIQVDGKLYDPKEHGVQSGDLITEVNGVRIGNMEDLYAQIATFTNPRNDIPITVKRGPQLLQLTLLTLYSSNDASFQSGLYVKDSISGVGTMTFYDPSHQSFGALGHEIFDTDTKEIADVHQGNIFPAIVTSISAAQVNLAGEKHAKIAFDQPLGTVTRNSAIGIYGHYDQAPENALRLPWAQQKEIHTGPAAIYTVLDGSQIQPYDIEITKLHKQDKPDVKGIEFRITDETLLAKTNGVIQGMSGSPIIQDGKIIGAITHVITSNPIQGYGVYIEWMLQEANQ